MKAKWAVEQVGVVYRAWMTGAAYLGGEPKVTRWGSMLASAGTCGSRSSCFGGETG